ncbi:phage tail tip lysozyme [Silvimonas soli]|uniref:phage tail tip lysozyme n=1 Tax=Silvimonas soli TaxID=2980100 RepID=UPI0024B34E69|nr:phage tail tip lysozyme [Silvimonas soli]
MASPDTIKDFLVSLGFQVDEKGLKKFTGGIADATLQVGKLVAAIAGAALTVGAGVAAFASNMESLYFASKRTGAAAANIRALESAAKDFGASADEARGSLESVARFMRNTPGGEGFLQSLGVQTRDANGQLRDTSDILIDLGKSFAKMPQYQANEYAQFLGISEKMQLALRDGDFEKDVQRKRQALKDSGMDKATEDAHKFMVQLRDLGVQFEALGVKIEAALLQKAGPILAQFKAWFDKSSPEIVDRITDVLVVLLRLVEEGAPVLLKLLDYFVQLDKETGGLSTQIIALTALFIAMGGPSVLSAIGGLLGGLNKVSAGAEAAAGSVGLIGKAFLLATQAATAYFAYQAGYKIGEKINEHLSQDTKDKIGGTIATVLAKLGVKEAQEALDINEGGGINKPTPIGKKSVNQKAQSMRGTGDARQYALNLFQNLGWSPEQAAGLVANLTHESGLNPGAVGDSGRAFGIAQWHPDRQAAYAKWSGKDIQKSSFEDQLRFVNYELTNGAEKRAGDLLRATRNAADAGSVVSRYYERPADQIGEAQKRSASAVQIAQDTKIYVQGSNDPAETARRVAEEQGRVSAATVRNFREVVS